MAVCAACSEAGEPSDYRLLGAPLADALSGLIATPPATLQSLESALQLRPGFGGIAFAFDGVADAHGLCCRRLALVGDGQRGDVGFAGTGLGDLHLDRLRRADNAKAGRRGHFEPAVELAFLAGQQRMHRRVEA